MIVPGIPYIGPAAAGRGSYAKRYMVIHCTANPTSSARGEAGYAKTRTDGVGLHFASDEIEVVQGLDTVPSVGHTGAGTTNRFGICWEFCATNGTPTAEYQRLIRVAAPVMRQVMAAHGIPHRWLTREQALDGTSRGLMTHNDSRQWFGGTDHTDPGPNFPRQYLIDALNGVSMTSAIEYGQFDRDRVTNASDKANAAAAALTSIQTKLSAIQTGDVSEQTALAEIGADVETALAGIAAIAAQPQVPVTQEMIDAAVAKAFRDAFGDDEPATPQQG